MPKPLRAYPADYQEKIVELLRSGRSANSIEREFGVPRQTCLNWLKRNVVEAGRRSDALTTSEHEELVRLRRENKQLRMEREILGKAAAWFARETVPKSSDS
jgi:transposase